MPSMQNKMVLYLTTKTFPTTPGPWYSCWGAFCRKELRYKHIPVKKSFGCPTSIQKPTENNQQSWLQVVADYLAYTYLHTYKSTTGFDWVTNADMKLFKCGLRNCRFRIYQLYSHSIAVFLLRSETFSQSSWTRSIQKELKNFWEWDWTSHSLIENLWHVFQWFVPGGEVNFVQLTRKCIWWNKYIAEPIYLTSLKTCCTWCILISASSITWKFHGKELAIIRHEWKDLFFYRSWLELQQIHHHFTCTYHLTYSSSFVFLYMRTWPYSLVDLLSQGPFLKW